MGCTNSRYVSALAEREIPARISARSSVLVSFSNHFADDRPCKDAQPNPRSLRIPAGSSPAGASAAGFACLADGRPRLFHSRLPSLKLLVCDPKMITGAFSDAQNSFDGLSNV